MKGSLLSPDVRRLNKERKYNKFLIKSIIQEGNKSIARNLDESKMEIELGFLCVGESFPFIPQPSKIK
jgi:hypothetical protein